MRKVKAEWTREIVDDLKINGSIDVNKMLEDILMSELKLFTEKETRIKKLESILIDIKK